MKPWRIFILVAALVTSTTATALTGQWERTKVECASGEQPAHDWTAWRVVLKFSESKDYTIIKSREDATMFETGEYVISDVNRICFKNDSTDNSIPVCYDLYFDSNDLRLGEYMNTSTGECVEGDYLIRYFSRDNPDAKRAGLWRGI